MAAPGRVVPGTKTRATTITNGPNPLAVAMVAALDTRAGLAAAGLLGHRIIGMKGSPQVSWRGLLPSPQTFKGWAGPNLAGMLPGAPMGLPMTATGTSASGPFKAAGT